MFKPVKINEFKSTPQFLRDGKYPQYTIGNAVLDGTKFTQDTVVKAGTAIFKNSESHKFELVQADTPATMEAACLVTTDTKVYANTDTFAPAIRNASVIEERCTGVTANFKEATKGRILFDI